MPTFPWKRTASGFAIGIGLFFWSFWFALMEEWAWFLLNAPLLIGTALLCGFVGAVGALKGVGRKRKDRDD